jgi:hypothetical protein
METHLIFIGIPLSLFVVLALVFLTRKSPHPATYQLPEPWTHAPILWAATDEAVGGHGGHGGHGSAFTVGGGASGSW